MRKARDNSAVTADTKLNVKDKVQVEWGGGWWNARVVALEADGRVKIRYEDWDGYPDEVVPRDRIQLGWSDETGMGLSADFGLPAAGICVGRAPVYESTLAAMIFGAPVSATSALELGDEVLADWMGMWWTAEVRDLQDDGRVRIHYTGWDGYPDEVVPRDRLRLPRPAGSTVRVHFDRAWSLTGKPVAITREFLTLAREPDGQTVTVNLQKIVYFEPASEA
jgi:hypothetical protein